MSHVELKKILAKSHVSVAEKSLRPLSNLRNDNVAYHFRFTPSCLLTKALCHMAYLRRARVVMSNLVVESPLSVLSDPCE